MSQAPNGVDNNTWRAALTSYLSECQGGDCKCLLVVSEKKGPSTHFMWAGKIAGTNTQEKFSSHGGMKATNAGGGGSGWDRSYNDSLPTCTTGNAVVGNGDGGDDCCVTRGGVDVCSGKCRYYQDRADVLNIPKNRRNRRIYYRSTLEGVFYLHEEAAQCKGPPCGRSFGCVRIYAQAMKSLCEDHIGMTAAATGRAYPANGGAYLYFQNEQSLRKGNMDSAARGLAAYERKCGGFSLSAMSNTPIQRGYAPAYASSSSSSSSSNTRPAARGGSSGNFLSAFFKFIFGGGGGAGPAASSTGAYQELANSR